MTNLSKAPIGAGLFLFAVSVGTLCGPPKNTTTRNENTRYWYCWNLVASEGQDQRAVLYSNAIFAGEYDYYSVRDGFRAFVKNSADTGGGGAAGCTTHSSLVSAQAAMNDNAKSFDKKYKDQRHEIRNTQWMYHPGDEKESRQ
jgi:hypothetical protein